MKQCGKRLLGLLLAAALCLTVGVNAFAEDGELTVYSMDGVNVYAVEGQYTVQIPEEVVIDPVTNKKTFKIDATLEDCSNLEIGITSRNDYKLVCGTQKLAYKISDQKVVLWKDNTDKTEESQTYAIDVEVTDPPTMSGTYVDYLTFTMTRKQYEEIAGKHLLFFDTNDESLGSNYGEETIISTDHKYVEDGGTYGMLPAPKHDGYDFAGWYTAKTAGEEVTEDTLSTNEDATVYAHWTPHKLTINYHNGGAEKWNHYPGNNNDIRELNPEEDIVVQTEVVAYDEQYDHWIWGILDVGRLTRTGYKSGNKWKVGSPDSMTEVSDQGGEEWSETNTDNGRLCNGRFVAKFIGVLDDLKKGDVTVDL